MTEPDAGTRTRMAAPPRQRRTLDALSLVLLLVALALHLHFSVLDTRGEEVHLVS